LNEVSCFPYENFLYKLKRLIRGRRKPLAQLFKKTYQLERETTLDWLDARRNETVLDTVRGNTTSDSYVLVKPGKSNINIIFLLFILLFSPIHFINTSGLVVKIESIPYIGNHVLATPMIMSLDEDGNYVNFFTSPCPATKLDIYVGQELDHGNVMQVYIF